MKYTLYFSFFLSAQLMFCSPGISQGVQVFELCDHIADPPVQFRKFVKERIGLKYTGTDYKEARLFIFDNFKADGNDTDFTLVRSYSPMTIVDAKGKGVKVYYVKGTKNFDKSSYEILTHYLQQEKDIRSDTRQQDNIKIQNVPEDLYERWLNYLVNSGTEEHDSRQNEGEHMKIFNYKDQYWITFNFKNDAPQKPFLVEIERNFGKL